MVKAKQAAQDNLLTVPEVARQLRVDGMTVRRWIRMGAMPAIVLPGRLSYRIKRETLMKIMEPAAV